MSNIPASYRKIHVVNKHAKSFAEQTKIVHVPVEPPGPNQILIKLVFTGIEASDIAQNAGQYGPLSTSDPEIEANGSLQVGDCGCEGVGVIVAIGEGVELQIGSTVLSSGFGTSFREYLTCSVSDVLPISMPASAEMVAIPVSAATAACGLEVNGRLKEGEKVLVTGAAGGTGQFAVQWAKIKHNAYVVGVCGSAEKESMLKGIGCDETINYRTEQDMKSAIQNKFPDGIDVAYEPVCGSLRDAVWANMAVFGRMLCIGSVGDDYEQEDAFSSHKIESNSGLFKSLTCTSFFMGNLAGDPRLPQIFGELMQYIADGKIIVKLDKASAEFKGLEGVYQAQEYIRTGKNIGKIYVSF